MADKKISELDLALLINDDAEFPISQDNAGEPTTFKGRITQLGTKIAEDMTFSNLRTTSKKLVGAINELLSLGSPIIIGTTAPTSSQGADGNIYVQYTEGTGGADDEVDGIYVKIDGAWCEIQTGGGSGTTDYEDLSNKPQVNSVELVGNKSLDDLGIMPASLSKTVSGSIAHFTDGADNIPVKSLTSQIVAVETGTGEKSPTNPYTISGFDNGVVSVCGVNLFDKTTATIGGWLNGNGGVNSGSNRAYSDYIPIKLNQPYYFEHVIGANALTTCIVYDNNKTLIGVSSVTGSTNTSGTLTFTSGAYIRVNTMTDNLDEMQISFGSTTPSEYNAYNGNTYTFAFGQTVYGGYFDNKGNLVVTHVIAILDGTENTWSQSTSYDFRITLANMKSGNFLSGIAEWLKTATDTSEPLSIRFGANNNIVYFYGIINNILGVTDLASWKTYLSNNPLKIVYELANPILFPITSQDIPTLLGENNIFSNTGDVEVNYYTNKADEIVEVSKATASTPLHHYSTDEQVVGTWIDGSTVYEKTFDLGSDINIDYTSWTETSISWQTLNVNRLVGTEGFTSSGGTFAGTLLASKKSNGNIEIQTPRNGTATGVRYLTIQYTKSST